MFHSRCERSSGSCDRSIYLFYLFQKAIPITIFLAMVLLIGILGKISVANAAEAVGQITPPLPATTTPPPSYKLGPGDELTYTIVELKDSTTVLTVLSDGSVTVPRYGPLSLQGKTVVEAREALQKALSEHLVHPTVVLTVSKPRPPESPLVHVLGAVNLSGPVEYKEGWRVAQVLAKAGGLKINANRASLTLTSIGGRIQELSAQEILDHPESAANAEVHPDDLLIVSEIPAAPIFITGAVERQGMYDLRDYNSNRGFIGVLEALALAGGPKPNAALSKAYILRADRSPSNTASNSSPGSTAISSGTGTPSSPAISATGSPVRREEPVNLVLLREGSTGNSSNSSGETGKLAANPSNPDALVLYSGDTLYIPESTAKIAVMGMVKTPGIYPLSEDHPMSLLEGLTQAGGLLPRSKPSKVGIIRADPSKGPQAPPQLLTVDFSLASKGNLSQNPELQPGDTIYVPESGKVDWFGRVLPGLSSVMQFVFLGSNILR